MGCDNVLWNELLLFEERLQLGRSVNCEAYDHGPESQREEAQLRQQRGPYAVEKLLDSTGAGVVFAATLTLCVLVVI